MMHELLLVKNMIKFIIKYQAKSNTKKRINLLILKIHFKQKK